MMGTIRAVGNAKRRGLSNASTPLRLRLERIAHHLNDQGPHLIKIQPGGVAMKRPRPIRDLAPSTQFQKPVLGYSLQLGKRVLGCLAVCAVALLSSWIAVPAADAVVSNEYKFKLPLGLEESAMVIPSDNPMTNPITHGVVNYDVMISKMKKIKGYKTLFLQAFGEDISIGLVGKAIASFQRTVLSGNSPMDRFDQGGEANAISPEAQRGLLLFRDKARCTKCHSGFNLTD